MKTQTGPDQEQRDADSILQFCRRFGMSRSAFYEMEKQGKGPRTFCIGGKGKGRRISREAAAEWRKGLEAESAAEG